MPKVRRQPFRLIIAGPAYMHGGTEQHTLSIAKFLDPRRIELRRVLVTNADLWDRDAQQPHGCPVNHCAPENLERETRNADCLMTWGIDTDQWLCPLASQARIHVAHGASDWSQKVLTGCSSTADHVVCVSKHVADRLTIPTEHTIITNGIDTSRLTESATRQETRAQLGFTDDDFVAGYVGRLAADKSVHKLIEAVAEIGSPATALICGQGPEEAQLNYIAASLAPDRVTFVQTDTFMGDIYQSMDCFVMPSQHEGFCLATAEAMWSGVPILMPPIGLAADDIFHGINGYITEPDAESITRHLRWIMAHKKERLSTGRNGRATAQSQYQARRMVQEYSDLIESLVEYKMPSQTHEEVPY